MARQLAQPSGIAGQLLGTAMDIANRRPTRLAVDLLAPATGEYVLDAGCGTGAGLAEILKRATCRVAGVDRSTMMIRRAASRLRAMDMLSAVDLHAAPLEAMPFHARAFDAILALNILYFCDPDALMVSALFKALKPGGRLVAYVTHRRSMERWRFARVGHHRLYDEPELLAVLAAGGFRPADIRLATRPIAYGVVGLFAIAETRPMVPFKA